MSKKPVGGRGKRESYSTSIVRIPNPIKNEVLFLIKQFHREREVNKNSTDLKVPRSQYEQLDIESFLKQIKDAT